jgi:hypothetical protein
MMAGSDSRRAIAGAMIGLLYGSTLALWSLVLFGSGHAISIPLFLSSAPLGVLALVGNLIGGPYVSYGYRAALLGAPLVWAALGSLVALSGRGSTPRLIQVLLLLHYGSGLALVATAGEGPAHLQRLPGIWFDIAMWATVYLAGQVALWSWMRAGSASRRAIVGAMLGLLYGSLLAFLSIVAAGGGHGTIVPLLLSSAPLSVFLYAPTGVSDAMLIALLLGALLVWAALGSLVALPGRGTRLRLAQLLILLQYASGLALLATRGAELLPLPSFVNVYLIVNVLVWATVYLVGQVALWWRMSRPAPHQPTQSNHAS